MAAASRAIDTGVAHLRPLRCGGGSLFLRLHAPIAAAVLLALFFLTGPRSESKTDGLALTATAPVESSATSAFEAPSAPVPRAGKVANLYVGPSQDYRVVGAVPKGGRLEVVGRNEDGEWLAVTLAPGSSMYAWLPASEVVNAPDSSDLATVPVVTMPAP